MTWEVFFCSCVDLKGPQESGHLKMGVPRKPIDVTPSFKRFFTKEAGWKSVVKVFGGVGLVCFVSYQFYQFQKRQKMFKSYVEGIELFEAGVQASDMGQQYYNEHRRQPDFAKCQVDTSAKLRYGQTILDVKPKNSES